MKKLLYAILVFIFSSQFLQAQPGCPNVTVAPTNPICNGSCTTLSASLQGTVATTAYTVDSIPYTPFSYNSGIPIQIGIDDLWSDTIQLPFCFDFFGTTYTKCIVGSNGCIGFNITNANTYNTWPINANIPSTTPVDMLNTIMGPWHDVDPSVTSDTVQFYELQGTAPCRRLVVSWYHVPMFQCNNLIATHQIVLYETTNIIEVYIENKPICATWNAGAAIEGIQDPTGTVAYVVPGRNFSDPAWTASNDAWRFTPAGAPQYTFSWYQGSTLISTSDTVTVCPGTTTTYTAQLINNACGGPVTVTSQATVTVNPSPTLSTSSTPTVCNGNNGTATVTATGNPPFGYSWSTTPVQTTATATGLAAGIYTVTVTNANGCSATATAQVTSTSSMNVSASVTGPNPICIGQSTTIASNITGGTPPYSYSWTPSATLSSSTTASTTATPTATTSYTVSITDSNNCVSAANVTVTVNPLPVVTPCSNSASICLGDSTLLCVTGADVFTWSPATGLSATTGNSVNASPAVTTTYTITGQNSTTLCSNTATITVTVNPLPLVATPPAPSICSGGSVQVCMSGAVTYSWQPSTGITGASGPDSTCVTVSATSSTNYTVTGYSAEGCSATITILVTVNPNPVPVITPQGPTVFCAGGSVDLQASPTGTYVWSNNANTQTINVSASGTFTVTVTDANGCTGTSAPVSVTVNPLPTPTISPATIAFCQGDSAVLTANGGVSYVWSDNSASANLTVYNGGTYTVTATDANGCISSTSVNVTVNPLPPAVISPAGPVLICSNNPATLTAPIGSGYTYQWYLNGNPIAGATNSTYDASVTGMYSVRVTDALGCTSLSTEVQVMQGLGPEVTIQGPPAFGCLANTIYIGYGPQSVTLTAVSSTAVSYLWSTGAVTQSISVTTSGSYSVTAYDANGCPSAQTPETEITINVIDVRCGNGLKKIILCHVPEGNPGNPQTICVAPSAIPHHLEHHQYDCIGPCSLYYNRDSQIMDDEVKVNLYPNPFSSTFIIDVENYSGETVLMNMYDVTGRILISGMKLTETIELGADLSEGVYHIEIITGDKKESYKIVKL